MDAVQACHASKLREESTHETSQWPSSGRWYWSILLAFVMLGVMARATRYLQGWDPWGDETALIINVLERDFAGLLRPLDNCQVAPAAYLWVTKASSLLLGVNELSLRLPAFVSSIAALFLMVSIARSVAPTNWAVFIAVGIFAVSNYHIRHSAEMKQYAMECLVSTGLIALALLAARFRPAGAWTLIAVMPLAMTASLTTPFVAGGVSLALLPVIWARRSGPWWAWYMLYNTVVGACFLAVYFLILKPQAAVSEAGMELSWAGQMPHWHDAAGVLKWILRTATGSLFAHPIGGENGESLPFVALFWIGVVSMWRRGDRLFLRLAAGTLLLAAIAALLRRYPLGGHPRLALYLSPFMVIPMAVGAASVAHFRTRDAALALRRNVAVLAVLAVIGLAGMVKDLAKPYFSPSSRNLGQFARWFWRDYALAAPGPLACIVQDGATLPPPPREHWYLYARHAGAAACRVPPVPERLVQPTGLVMCNALGHYDGTAALRSWREKVQNRYEIFDHDFFIVTGDKPFHAVRYDVLWVRPMPSGSDSATVPVLTISRKSARNAVGD
jgi:hypothetical protein